MVVEGVQAGAAGALWHKEKPPDLEQAYTLMLQEAEIGNGYAMHDMGKILLQGMGRDKDEAAAQGWFRKAYTAFQTAEQTADKKDYLQYRIGKLFSYGYGVEQDYAQAAEWYSKAVAERNPFAAYSLGGLCKRGQGVEQDDKRAFHLFCLAAEHERKPNAYAMYELGRMYKQGIGTEPDEGLSEKWYAAAYQGFVEMEKTMNDDKLQYRLGQMTMNGVGTEEDLPRRLFVFPEVRGPRQQRRGIRPRQIISKRGLRAARCAEGGGASDQSCGGRS